VVSTRANLGDLGSTEAELLTVPRCRRTPRPADQCHRSRGKAQSWLSAEHSVVLRQMMDLLGGAVRGGERIGRAPAWLLRHAHVCVYAVLVS
jgi:hypothetical protein